MSWDAASAIVRDPWAQVSRQTVGPVNGVDFELRITENYPMRLTEDRPLQISSGFTQGGQP